MCRQETEKVLVTSNCGLSWIRVAMQGWEGFSRRFVLLALIIVAMYTIKLRPIATITKLTGRGIKDER